MYKVVAIGLCLVLGTAMFRFLSVNSASEEPSRFGELREGGKAPTSESGFAADRAPKLQAVKAIAIDPERCLKNVQTLCDLGPRISGSAGMKKQQELLVKLFESYGAATTKQVFKIRQRSQRDETEMTNLIFSWHPDRKRRVILCSHYDTRPGASEEIDRRDWSKPFLSANDGTSGVALLMEIGRQMKEIPVEVGVDIVFFDGEEFIFEPGYPHTNENPDKYFFGSEEFARRYTERKKEAATYEAAILLDLFAGEGARLAVEGKSYRSAPKVIAEVWEIAEKLGVKSFVAERGFRRAEEVNDDHVALNSAGIPAIDIIDFDYKHWHLLSDTPDKLSGKQMADVGKVLTAWLQMRK